MDRKGFIAILEFFTVILFFTILVAGVLFSLCGREVVLVASLVYCVGFMLSLVLRIKWDVGLR